MNSFASLATAHLILRLQPLHRALRAMVERQRLAAARLDRPELSSLCLTDEHVRVLLDQIDESQGGCALACPPPLLTPAERNEEARLRAQCGYPSHALP